jgi:hypothetical protein
MSPVLLAVLVACGGVAGSVGWRRATGPINRQPLYRLDLPPGMTRREYERRRRRRRKLERLFVTVAYAVTGAVGGIVFLMLINRH